MNIVGRALQNYGVLLIIVFGMFVYSKINSPNVVPLAIASAVLLVAVGTLAYMKRMRFTVIASVTVFALVCLLLYVRLAS